MALYPTLTEARYLSISGSPQQKVLSSNFDDLGKIQVKRKWLYKRRNLNLNYSKIIDTQFRTLMQFWSDRSGAYNIFTFIFPPTYSDTYESEYVGTGDDSNTVFNLPTKNTSSRTIYVDGSNQTEAPDATSAGNFYVIEDGGQDGVDSCIFFTAPTSGQRITIDFVGQLAVRTRFMEGGIQYDRTKRGAAELNNVSVSFRGTLMNE